MKQDMGNMEGIKKKRPPGLKLSTIPIKQRVSGVFKNSFTEYETEGTESVLIRVICGKINPACLHFGSN